MSFPLINPYQQFFDSSGAPLVGGTIEFRSPTTNALINTYPTAVDADAQTNANDNPLTLNSKGAAEEGLFLEDGVSYKVILKDLNGATVKSDDYVKCPIALPYAQTAAESAAGVTPTNVEYPPGDVRRYGADPTGGADSQPAIQSAVDAMKQSRGNTVYIPGGTYRVDSEVLIDENVNIQGDGSKSLIQPNGETFAVFRLEGATDNTLNKWRISDIRIQWASVATNTAAVGIKLDDSGGASRFPFGGVIERVNITNASTGYMDDTDAFDIQLNNVKVGQSNSHSFDCQKSGGTMYSFKNCYADSPTGRGFWITNSHFVHMSGCAVDGTDNASEALRMTTCSGHIDTFDIEACTTTATELALFSNCIMTVNGLRCFNNTISATDAAIVKTTSGSSMTFSGGRVFNTTATGSNNCYALNVTSTTTSLVIMNYGLTAPTGGSGTHADILDSTGKIIVRIDGNGLVVKGAVAYTPSEVTIASGAVTVTRKYHKIDTEGDASSDDLDTITGNGFTGQELILSAANAGRTVVVKHGTDNIVLDGSTDFSLTHTDDIIQLIYNGTNWCQVSSSNNAA